MGVYSVSTYGTGVYGIISPTEFATELVVKPRGYDELLLSWAPPSGSWSHMRLLRSSYGFPMAATSGGTVVLDTTKNEAPTSVVDRGLHPGRFYYYTLFVFSPDDAQWIPATAAMGLVTEDHGNHDSMWNLLPQVYKEHDVLHGEPLNRFVEMLGYQLDRTRTEIDTLKSVGDIDLVSGGLLPVLAESLGVAAEPELGMRVTRSLVKNAVHLAKIKGTTPGVEGVSSVFTDFGANAVVGKNLLADKNASGWVEPTRSTWTVAANTVLTANAEATYAPPIAGLGTLTAAAVAAGDMVFTSGLLADHTLIAVREGEPYVATIHTRHLGTARTVTLSTIFYAADGTVLATVNGQAAANTDAWVRRSVVATAPVGAVWAAIQVTVAAAAAGEAHLFGAAQFEPGTQAGSLDLDGAGDYASTPDANRLDVTGDIDVRVKAAADDWTPSGSNRLINKWGTGTSSWLFEVRGNGAGTLGFSWIDAGGTIRTAVSSVATGIADGTVKWVRTTLDVDNGASGHDVKFWLSDDGTTWTQLGATVNTGAFTTTVRVGDTPLVVGMDANGTSSPFDGTIYSAEVRNGIDGAVVASFDAENGFVGQTGGTVTTPLPDAFVHLDGAGDYLTTPDSDALDVTGDLDIVVRAALPDWTPATTSALIAKEASSSQRSYRLALSTTGTLALLLSSDGTNFTSVDSGTAVAFVNGETGWTRVTWRQSDGRVQFFTSTDGSTWTQLGTDKAIAMASIYSSTSQIELGTVHSGGALPLAGLIHHASVRNGIDGPVVARYDASDAKANGEATTVSSATGETWTYQGNASVAIDTPWSLQGDAVVLAGPSAWESARKIHVYLEPRRSNLAANPSIETDLAGWSALPGSKIARSTAQAASGAASLAVTSDPAVSGVTFTRASTAYLDSTQVASGVPRYPLGRNLATLEVSNVATLTHFSGYAGNTTVSLSTAQVYVGTTSLMLEAVAAGNVSYRTTSPTEGTKTTPVIAGLSYTASAHFRADATGRQCNIQIVWRDAAGSYVGVSGGGTFADTATDWTRGTATGTAPANAAYAFLVFNIADLAAGEDHYIDGIQIEQASTATPFRPGGPQAILIEEGTTNLLPSATAGWTAYAATVDQQADRLVVTGAAPPAATFTRASTAHLDGVEVASGTPRYPLGRNLLTRNQSDIETDTAGFTANANSTVSRSTAQALYGAASLAVTSVAAGNMNANTNTHFPEVVAGETYTGSIFIRSSAARGVRISLSWRNASGTHMADTVSSTVTTTTTGWTRITATGTAPVGAASVFVRFYIDATAAGEVHYIDGLQFEKGPLTPWRPGGPSAVLIEEGTTNLVSLSASEMETVQFTTGGTTPPTVVADTAVKLQGTASNRLTFPASAVGGHAEGYANAGDVSQPDGTTYTYSAWIRSTNWAATEIVLTGSHGIGGYVEVERFGDWRRYARTNTNSTGVTQTLALYIRRATANAEPFDVWVDQVQTEQKAYATSWHPGGATRAWETLAAPHEAVSPTEGTIEIDVNLRSWDMANNRVFEVKRSTGGNGLLVYRPTTTTAWYLHVTNDAGTATVRSSANDHTPPGAIYRFAVAWDANGIRFLINGTQIGTNVPISEMPTAFSAFGFGYAPSNVNHALNQPILGVRVSSRARTNTELADYTALLTADADTTYAQTYEGNLTATAQSATIKTNADVATSIKALSAGNADADRRILMVTAAGSVARTSAWGDTTMTDAFGGYKRAGFQLRGLPAGATRTILRPQGEDKLYATSWQAPGTTRVGETLQAPHGVDAAAGTIELDLYATPGLLGRWGAGQDARLVTILRPDNSGSAVTIYKNGNNLAYYFIDENRVGHSSIAEPISGITEGWHRFVLVWDGPRVAAWRNGVLVGEVTMAAPLHSLNPTAVIGSGHAGSVPSNSSIDAIRFSNRARTTTELADWTTPLDDDDDTTFFQTYGENLSYFSDDARGAVYGPTAVTAGEPYTASVAVRSSGQEESIRAVIQWLDGANNTVAADSVGTAVEQTDEAWVRVSASGLAPVGAVSARVRTEILGAESVDTHYVDSLLIERTEFVKDYFDASLFPPTDYLWDGPGHASASYYYPRRMLKDERLRDVLPDYLPAGTDFEIHYGETAPASSV